MVRSVLMVVLLAIATACASSPASKVPEATGEWRAPDATPVDVNKDLTIKPYDQLEIKVFNLSDLDGIYQVEPEGEIKMPLLGAVSADGQTVFEFADLLEARLEENYLQDALVSVRISEAYNAATYTTEGAISRPGSHPVRGDMTLMQAIAQSGGLAANANPEAVVIFRVIDGQRSAARFDLQKIRSGKAHDPAVYGDDIIMVDARGENRAYDEVLRSLPLVGLFMALL